MATNAVIMGDFARVGLLATAGFEDILEIATQQRADLYDPWRGKPAPIVPRDRVRGVRERIGADGAVVDALLAQDVRDAARAWAGEVDAVAIAFLFSFANPAHEEEAAAILARELPGIPRDPIEHRGPPSSASTPRAATTALNAARLCRAAAATSPDSRSGCALAAFPVRFSS